MVINRLKTISRCLGILLSWFLRFHLFRSSNSDSQWNLSIAEDFKSLFELKSYWLVGWIFESGFRCSFDHSTGCWSEFVCLNIFCKCFPCTPCIQQFMENNTPALYENFQRIADIRERLKCTWSSFRLRLCRHVPQTSSIGPGGSL